MLNAELAQNVFVKSARTGFAARRFYRGQLRFGTISSSSGAVARDKAIKLVRSIIMQSTVGAVHAAIIRAAC